MLDLRLEAENIPGENEWLIIHPENPFPDLHGAQGVIF